MTCLNIGKLYTLQKMICHSSLVGVVDAAGGDDVGSFLLGTVCRVVSNCTA